MERKRLIKEMDGNPVTFLHEADGQQADKDLQRLQGKRARDATPSLRERGAGTMLGMLTTLVSGILTVLTALATTLLLLVGIDVRATDPGTSMGTEMSDTTDLDFMIKDIVENKRSDAARLLRQKADELEKMDATSSDREQPSSSLTKSCLNFESGQIACKSEPSANASSRMCTRHPSVQLLMCLECAKEKSSVQVTSVPYEFAEIDNFLRMWCKRREPVPGDGHCIVNSWTKALEIDWQFCYPGGSQALLHAAIDEISEHQEFYGPFLSPDWRKELDAYLDKNEYHKDVADLLIQALCNVTQASCQIITLSSNNIRVEKAFLPSRLKKLPTRDVVLCPVGSHYDAAVSTWGSTEDDNGLETSTKVWKKAQEDKGQPSENDEFSDLTEPEKQRARKDLKGLQDKTAKMMTKAKDTATSLREAADKLDKVWKDCKIAHATGTSVGIAGGILAITGEILRILSKGAAEPVLIAGYAVEAAAAGTNLVTRFVETCINSREIKKAEKDLEETLHCINDVDNTVQLLLNRKEREKLSYICLLAVQTLDLKDPVVKILRKVSDTLGSSGKALEVAEKKVQKIAEKKAEKKALKAGKGGDQADSDVSESGAKADAKAGGKLAGALNIGGSAVFLVFDSIDLGFTIRDIVRKKGSEAARFLRQKADKLEKVC